jgi:hypothetical protein
MVVGVDVVVVRTFTPTDAGDEKAVAEALSVTSISKFQVPSISRLPVDVVGNEDVSQLNELPKLLYELAVGDSCSHWQVYGEVPSLNGDVAESSDESPLPTFVGLAEITGAASAGFTVTDVVPVNTTLPVLSVSCTQ